MQRVRQEASALGGDCMSPPYNLRDVFESRGHAHGLTRWGGWGDFLALTMGYEPPSQC